MKNLIMELQAKMEQQLEDIAAGNAIDQARESISVVLNVLHELKSFILDYTFSGKDEEVLFFRSYMPNLYCNLLYYKQVLDWEVHAPFSSQAQARFYDMELERLNKIISSEIEFVAYCRTGNTSLDDAYFTRNQQFNSFYAPDLTLTGDTRFCTVGSLRLANVLATEMLIRHIEKRRLNSTVAQTSQSADNAVPAEITFTGTKNDLTELIFAFHSGGLFGNATVKQIATWFEQHLHVNLNNYYRVFQSLRIRKNPTQCLSFLITALNKRMDEADLNPRY